MANKEQTEVTTAYLQAVTSIPGIIGAQTRLDQEKTPGIVMHLGAFGLIVSKDGNSAVIPYPNVKMCLLKNVE